MKKLTLKDNIKVIEFCLSCPCRNEGCNFGVYRPINSLEIPPECPLEDYMPEDKIEYVGCKSPIYCRYKDKYGRCESKSITCVYAWIK